MKRFTPVAMLMLLTVAAQAQFDQWTIYATGLGTYAYQDHDEKTYSSSQCSTFGNVAIGVFPVKKLMIGIGSGLMVDKSKAELMDPNFIQKIDHESSSFTIGPLARYYIFKGLYGEASYLMGKSRMEQDMIHAYYNDGPIMVSNQELKTKLRGFSAGIGYSVFLDRGKHLAVDVGISYQRHKIDDVKFSGMAAGFGISGFIFRMREN